MVFVFCSTRSLNILSEAFLLKLLNYVLHQLLSLSITIVGYQTHLKLNNPKIVIFKQFSVLSNKA